MFKNRRADSAPLGERRNFQLGIRARATSQRRTFRHEANIHIPPSHSKAFKISAWGEAANKYKFSKAVFKSCSSAGRTLDVNKKSKVGINA